jgi:hypothetical protein
MELNFSDITPIEELVTVGKSEYVLREMSGDAAVKYDNARLNCHEYKDGKLYKLRDLGDLEPLLVSLCLFTSEGTPVSEVTVRAWPARVQRALHQRAREISGMVDTPQSLKKQIEDLQRQLEDSRKTEGVLKN